MGRKITIVDLVHSAKAYIQSVVDRVEVDEDIVRTYGSKSTLERVIAGRAAHPAGVRNFARKWGARRDSNS